MWTVRPSARALGPFLLFDSSFFFSPGACAPKKTKVEKVTKQSFRRMPVPNFSKPGGAHSGEVGVV